ncbi:GL11602 [Drosophila persimilis]|uniref:Uncharacterized protein n=2 Tax=pseudoobscura subgroup TaxID=32358 RepID=A0A6I8V4J7_DROPS|nr:uncharacterized protein LOC6898423 [Drosophila pseudoobscura]XP_026842706.1 uncharacterized protein LOC6591127 [Drosophila persimilis]EDW32377.1 GL11602 [Drosophila persimilis]
MPCCKRNEIRRNPCRSPSILARLNCVECNRLLIFMVGVGLGALYIRKFNEAPQTDKKKK